MSWAFRIADKGALSDFCVDLTARASEGKIDPVIGRDKEVQRVVQILARRTKNNPILLGEPGVGKTAIAEGLAVRIVSGDVPDFLSVRFRFFVTIRLLDCIFFPSFCFLSLIFFRVNFLTLSF